MDISLSNPVYQKVIQRLNLYNNWIVNYDTGRHAEAKKHQTFDRSKLIEKPRVDFYKGDAARFIPIIPVGKAKSAAA